MNQSKLLNFSLKSPNSNTISVFNMSWNVKLRNLAMNFYKMHRKLVFPIKINWIFHQNPTNSIQLLSNVYKCKIRLTFHEFHSKFTKTDETIQNSNLKQSKLTEFSIKINRIQYNFDLFNVCKCKIREFHNKFQWNRPKFYQNWRNNSIFKLKTIEIN